MIKPFVGSPDRARMCESEARIPGHEAMAVEAPTASIARGPVRVALACALLACAALACTAVLSTALASTALASPVVASADSGAGHTVAWAAQAQVANDDGNLHLVGESGADLVEEGQMTGTLPGRAKLLFSIGATVSATFTLYPRSGGSISGHGSGKLTSSGRYASFGGSMAVTSGTGRYKHAHGVGGFYGTILRKSPYPVVVQTRGTLSF
jgi:hypothetical protein